MFEFYIHFFDKTIPPQKITNVQSSRENHLISRFIIDLNELPSNAAKIEITYDRSEE